MIGFVLVVFPAVAIILMVMKEEIKRKKEATDLVRRDIEAIKKRVSKMGWYKQNKDRFSEEFRMDISKKDIYRMGDTYYFTNVSEVDDLGFEIKECIAVYSDRLSIENGIADNFTLFYRKIKSDLEKDIGIYAVKEFMGDFGGYDSEYRFDFKLKGEVGK